MRRAVRLSYCIARLSPSRRSPRLPPLHPFPPTAALTTRGFVEADFERVADFLHEAVLLSLEVQKSCGKMLVDFVSALKGRADLAELKLKVRARAGRAR